jgi:hypothetical protein
MGKTRREWNQENIPDTIREFYQKYNPEEKKTTVSESDVPNADDVKFDEYGISSPYTRQPYKEDSFIMNLIGQLKPEDNKDNQDRLRRMAKVQALGDLFKHIGTFAGGRGYAPVERRQDNNRLYQILGMAEEDRKQQEAKEDRYRNAEVSYLLNDYNTFKKTEDAKEMESIKRIADMQTKNIDNRNAHKRWQYEQNAKNAKTTKTETTPARTETGYKDVVNPALRNLGRTPSGTNPEKDESLTYIRTDNPQVRYRIPKNKINLVASKMVKLGIIKGDEIEIMKQYTTGAEYGAQLANVVAARMYQFEQMAKLVPHARQDWDDVMPEFEYFEDVKKGTPIKDSRWSYGTQQGATNAEPAGNENTKNIQQNNPYTF